jgi:hypothetical protein
MTFCAIGRYAEVPCSHAIVLAESEYCLTEALAAVEHAPASHLQSLNNFNWSGGGTFRGCGLASSDERDLLFPLSWQDEQCSKQQQ